MAYEDFTTYTEVDPDEELTVTANKIHVSDQDYDADSWVYKDFGEDYFNGDFIHRLELTITACDAFPYISIWAMCNVSTGYLGIMMADAYMLILTLDPSDEGDYSLMLMITEDDIGSNDLLFNTRYYLTVERHGTTHTVTIRTGSHDGDVVDIIEVIGDVEPFRYLYSHFEAMI